MVSWSVASLEKISHPHLLSSKNKQSFQKGITFRKKEHKGIVQIFIYPQLQTSKKRAVETTDLTKSFGWGSSEGI